MKSCLSCNAVIQGDAWRCQNCAWSPPTFDDITLFAPHISGATESYDPAWYKELASLEEGNFWFVARNRLIRWLFQKNVSPEGKYLEVGCGTGFVLKMISKSFSGLEILATEAQPESFEFVRERVPNCSAFYQMDACQIPFREEFDVIGAFDVIEHIEDDVGAIEQIRLALKPGGFFILSVPQHMFLWSEFDEVGCHFRRYSADELKRKLSVAGFELRISTSFNSLLLPLMLLSRSISKKNQSGEVDVLAELRLSKFVNRLLSAILWVEFQMIRFGIRFPAGGSRMVVAQKTEDKDKH